MPVQIMSMTLGEIMFTHFDDKTGEQRSWAVGRLLKDERYHQLETHRVALDPAFAEFCLRERGVEQHRLQRLQPAHCCTPVTFVFLPEDDSHVLIDGVHRYVRAAQLGWPAIPARMLTPELDADYRIIGYPVIPEEYRQAFINRYSGIK